MNIPSEISALVRASTATIKAFRALRDAERVDASAAAKSLLSKALTKALVAQERALGAVVELARRPNEPIDWDKLFGGVMRGIEAAKQLRSEALRIEHPSGLRHLAARAKKVIDV